MQIDSISWRDRVFISIPDAATIFARSPSWVRDRVTEGRLELAQIAKGGPAVLTVESVAALADELLPCKEQSPARAELWPRLVWIHPEFTA